jgi:tetraacyldisaccharide 4'-kinase
VDVPVISVGNVTAGGTGKTPMVAWLASWYRQRGTRVALISRGYGAESGARNDEALELERQLPDVPHLQNPDRVAAARTAIARFESELLLLDDAFQHRRLHRDLDLVLIDASEPFGYGHLLPRGLLREPLSALKRADVVALSRADLVGEEQRQALWRKLSEYAPQAATIEIVHRSHALCAWSGQRRELPTLEGRRVAAFCGIGNPAAFRQSLVQRGVQLALFQVFADHFPYGRADVESLAGRLREQQIEDVICTGKDLVKLQVDQLGGAHLWALEIGIEFLSGRDQLESRLASLA